LQKKGASNIQGVNQLHSSIGEVIKAEEAGGASEQSHSGRKFNLKDRQSNDILNWTNPPSQEDSPTKRRNWDHKAAQNSGNFLQWQ